MKLEDALPMLEKARGVPLGVLFSGLPIDLRTNKGHTGQLLTKYIGLKHCTDRCDFENGELKTNKTDRNGKPLETMWIRQISADIDTLVARTPTPFCESPLYDKIRNLVYVPIVKESTECAEWYFTQYVHVQIIIGSNLYNKLQEDYLTICRGLRTQISSGYDGLIHTCNGPHYLQVRSKDAKPYKPVFSRTFDRYISNKDHGFYFMKAFMQDAASGLLDL